MRKSPHKGSDPLKGSFTGFNGFRKGDGVFKFRVRSLALHLLSFRLFVSEAKSPTGFEGTPIRTRIDALRGPLKEPFVDPLI